MQWFVENIQRKYNNLNMIMAGDFNINLEDFSSQMQRLNLFTCTPADAAGFYTRRGNKENSGSHIDHIASNMIPGILFSVDSKVKTDH